MVTLSMLISDLGPWVLSVSPEQKTFREYRGIYMIDGLTATEQNMIYVGSCDSVTRLLVRGTLADNCVIFSAGDSDALRNAPVRGIILVITSLSVASLYNQLTRTLLQCEDWQQLLSTGARKGMKPLLQAAARQFGFSVMLLSPNLRPMLRSIQDGEEALMPLDPEKETSAPQTALANLLKQLEDAGNASAVVTERKTGYVYGLIPISREHTILSYLFACSSGSRSTLQNILYVMAPAIARLMLDDTWQTTKTDTFQTLAAQFLGDRPDDLDKLEVKLKQLPTKPKRFMRGIIIRSIDDDGQPLPVYPQNLRQMYHEVQNLFPLDNAAILDECIYIMTSDEKPDAPITIPQNDAFEALLQKYHAYAMVSNPSQRLQGVRVLFRQCFQILPAAIAIRLPVDAAQRCLRFDRYAPYYIIQLCEQSAKNAMNSDDILYLCHPAVLTLTRYDRAYNSNLRDTLFNFLMNDRSISATSRKLFMHRNTTIYKLNKIQELINDDLENPYTRHQLILSCMIIRYVEQYQHAPFNLPPLESSLLRK